MNMTIRAAQSGGASIGGKRIGLLLIDFQQKDRSHFTYEHGPLNDGIIRTASVISCARSAGIPVILVSGRLSREIFPEISSAAGEGAMHVVKRGIDAFKEPDLETMLNAYDVDALVVGGWIRHICVMATASEAIRRGFSVMTSDEILFGDREMANLAARRTCLDFFRKNCMLFDSADALIQGMKGTPDNENQSMRAAGGQIGKDGLRAL